MTSNRKKLIRCVPSGRVMTKAQYWKIYWRERRARERYWDEHFPLENG